MSISLTVMIPTLNEGESIGPTIDQIPRNLPWLDVKVLIIDGNSTDNTAEEAVVKLIAEVPEGAVTEDVPCNIIDPLFHNQIASYPELEPVMFEFSMCT